MTSLQTSIKQIPSDGGYFITLADMVGKVYNDQKGATNEFTAAAFASLGSKSLSSISSQGAVLRDMGKTVVSSLRTFRKVQVVQKNGVTGGVIPSTFGVGGGPVTGEEYLTGYIELGFEGYGTPAPVAQFGR